MTNHTSIYATLRTLLTTLAVGCLAACSDGGDELQPSENTGSTLSVSFTVSGSSGKTTRASLESTDYEPGNTDLNENKIQRLDILVYDEDGKRILHNYWDGSNSDNATLANAAATDASNDETGLSNAQYTLTAENVPNVEYAGKHIYVVANWTDYDDASTATLAGLQAANMTPESMADQKADDYVAGFVPYKQQQLFLMDGSCTPEAADVTCEEKTDGNGNKTGNTTTTVSSEKPIELRRAIAKIRLHILNESGQELYAPHLFYRLMQYASTVNIVADNSIEASKTVALANYPLDNAEEKIYESVISGSESPTPNTRITIKTNYGRIREEEIGEDGTDDNGNTTYTSTPGAYNIVVEGEKEDATTGVVKTNDARHNGTTYTGYVFYVCPNHWMKRTDVRLEEPADNKRRTSVILMAPYRGAMYYYRVPLMPYMPTDADLYDTTTDKGWADFVEEYEKNYCVQRNHIYDITVTIDRAGGATEKTSVLVTNLQYQAIDWRERNSDDITFF